MNDPKMIQMNGEVDDRWPSPHPPQNFASQWIWEKEIVAQQEASERISNWPGRRNLCIIYSQLINKICKTNASLFT